MKTLDFKRYAVELLLTHAVGMKLWRNKVVMLGAFEAVISAMESFEK
jgi:hypothetical protein